MSFLVVLTDLAYRDLRQSYKWLADRNRNAADRWRDSLLAAADLLVEKPERCPLAMEEELADLGIRQLLHGKRSRMHGILFRVPTDTVQTLRFRHSSQDSLSPEDLNLSSED